MTPRAGRVFFFLISLFYYVIFSGFAARSALIVGICLPVYRGAVLISATSEIVTWS